MFATVAMWLLVSVSSGPSPEIQSQQFRTNVECNQRKNAIEQVAREAHQKVTLRCKEIRVPAPQNRTSQRENGTHFGASVPNSNSGGYVNWR